MDFTGEGTGWCVSCYSEEARFSQCLGREELSGLTESKVQMANFTLFGVGVGGDLTRPLSPLLMERGCQEMRKSYASTKNRYESKDKF